MNFDYGPLFAAVREQRIFADSKTFVDCVPKFAPAAILADYLAMAQSPGAGFNLREFIQDRFVLPPIAQVDVPSGQGVEQHIHTLWRVLRREPDLPQVGSSLLPLPFPYIVPGGRFREIYYWDSYFTMLGLRESGEEEMIGNMADNFAQLIRRYGFVPNGNRTYYLSRSQPPCFALMVELIIERRGTGAYARYLPALQAEYDYWMDRTASTAHVVRLPDGSILNRYYDQLDIPRAESFAEDEELVRHSAQERNTLLRHVRSAAESGWDFSSRWFADGQHMTTIETTNLVPVDLNCFLYQLEITLAKAYRVNGRAGQADELQAASQRRERAIGKYCWAAQFAFFGDYEISGQRISDRLSLAGVFPLFFKLATADQARAGAHMVREKFLQPGGVVTTLRTTGQQWDAPNGWAPLQWLTIQGLENYGYHELAAEIARRWIRLNCETYVRTGKLMEKYNVVDINLDAGGGEYPSQDGFGWTNGVLIKLLKTYVGGNISQRHAQADWGGPSGRHYGPFNKPPGVT